VNVHEDIVLLEEVLLVVFENKFIFSTCALDIFLLCHGLENKFMFSALVIFLRMENKFMFLHLRIVVVLEYCCCIIIDCCCILIVDLLNHIAVVALQHDTLKITTYDITAY
jgi:hypothetical protein